MTTTDNHLIVKHKTQPDSRFLCGAFWVIRKDGAKRFQKNMQKEKPVISDWFMVGLTGKQRCITCMSSTKVKDINKQNNTINAMH
ncbi:MAG: hypothetical protein J6K72_01865 [Clostridia bacterium]|nr:hypothetical protein [Clostridia bacterium]